MGGPVDPFVFLNLFLDFFVGVFFKPLLFRIFGPFDAAHRTKELPARHRRNKESLPASNRVRLFPQASKITNAHETGREERSESYINERTTRRRTREKKALWELLK